MQLPAVLLYVGEPSRSEQGELHSDDEWLILMGNLRPFADFMRDYVLEMDEKIEGEYKGLPEQLIHGDMHYDNILVDKTAGKVTGILDFEFVMYDWRAMELAICLSKYAGEEGALRYFEDFISGYSKTAPMTEKEAEAVPWI